MKKPKKWPPKTVWFCSKTDKSRAKVHEKREKNTQKNVKKRAKNVQKTVKNRQIFAKIYAKIG